MTELSEIYRCDVCGNVTEVLHTGAGELVCCGEPMELMAEKTEEQEGNEKHVPVASVEDGEVKVSVGSVPHPMDGEHYIEIIEILKDGKVVLSKRLSPGDEPESVFCMEDTEGVTARVLCNIHGLWKS
ncbi:MAG: desulfoferrodoxin [archaeon]|nr:desulfoferrodoxin [archaeon]